MTKQTTRGGALCRRVCPRGFRMAGAGTDARTQGQPTDDERRNARMRGVELRFGTEGRTRQTHKHKQPRLLFASLLFLLSFFAWALFDAPRGAAVIIYIISTRALNSCSYHNLAPEGSTSLYPVSQLGLGLPDTPETKVTGACRSKPPLPFDEPALGCSTRRVCVCVGG